MVSRFLPLGVIDRYSLAYLLTALAVFVLVALTLPVNPFPVDGWYASQDVLFGRPPGRSNKTPVALPAVVFWLGARLNEIHGGGPASQMYVTATIQNVLLVFSGFLVLIAGKRLGLCWPAYAAATVLMLCGLCTYMTMSFWSEATVFFFMTLAVFLIVSTHTRSPPTTWRAAGKAIVFGSLVGALTVTRVTPVVLLAGYLIVLWSTNRPGRAALLTALSITALLALIAGQLLANQYRFGRYELSNSAPLHLWNAVSDYADEVLDGSPHYAVVKEHLQDAQGKRPWQLRQELLDQGFTLVEVRVLIDGMARYLVTERPVSMLFLGFRKSLDLVAMAPDRFGQFPPHAMDASIRRNPLGRHAYLPALVAPAGLSRPLDAANDLFREYYPYLVAAVWISVISSMVVCIAFTSGGRTRQPSISAVRPAQGSCGVWPLILALAIIYLGMTYLTALIERPIGRLQIIILPVTVMLLLSAGASLAGRFHAAPVNRRRPPELPD